MKLPIESHIPEILQAFESYSRVLVEAEPGAGKSTLLPLEFMRHHPKKKIVLLQPRRLAAKNLATRLSQLNESPIGQDIGYQVRGESKFHAETQLLVMTQGIFLRRMLEDPELKNVDVILMDEFHERHLDGDFILAAVQDVQDFFREDLQLGILSATLDSQRLLNLLGDDCYRSFSAGRAFPVEIENRELDPNDLKKFSFLVQTMTKEIRSGQKRLARGHILCFLPGVGEINALQSELEGSKGDSWEILPLHGSLSLRDQAKIMQDTGNQKVILATNIAESSLTVPGVKMVIDSGLEKVARWNPALDVQSIEMELCSQASCTQRTGRAGRTSAGICVRLWPPRVDGWRRKYQEAAILREDLVTAQLNWKRWGEDECSRDRFLDIPKLGFWTRATQILQDARLLNSKGELNSLAKKSTKMVINPRLMSLFWAEGGRNIIWYLAALLSEDKWPPSQQVLCLKNLIQDKYLPREVNQRIQSWEKSLNKKWSFPVFKEDEINRLLIENFSHRLCWRQGKQFTQVSGVGLLDGPSLPEGYISLYQTGKNLRSLVIHPICKVDLKNHLEEKVQLDFVDGKWKATQDECFYNLVIHSQPSSLPKGELMRETLWNTLVSWSQDAEAADSAQDWLLRFWKVFEVRDADLEFLQRLAFYQKQRELEKEATWRRDFDRWLESYFSSIQEFADLKKFHLKDLWLNSLPYELQSQFKISIPTKWTSPSGRIFKVDYSSESPKVSCRLQDVLGLNIQPMVAGTPILLELLSPARRPIQMTQDLPGFWQGSYSEVRKEMKGRYPKHNWPEDPLA